MLRKFFIILIILSTFLVYFRKHQRQSMVVGPPLVQNITSFIENIKVEPLYTIGIPSVSQIFSDNHKWEATLSAERIRTLIATGDVIPARSVNFQALQRKDFNWPYLKTADVTKQADITFANLETPLIDTCKPTQEGMVFCGDSRNVEGLVYAGINVVSLANNHAGNYGTQGVQETVNLLSQNNILVTGVNGPAIKNVKGITFAFLGYDDITKYQPEISHSEEEKIKDEITDARKRADIVIVAFHWGEEYRDQPDDRQKYLGHLAVDSGADLVIGNHPHWIQPIEIYKDALITYAHGNFIFDQMWSQKTREGVIGKYTFFDKQLIDVEYLPVQINNYGQPYPIEGTQKQSILDHMKTESLMLYSAIH